MLNVGFRSKLRNGALKTAAAAWPEIIGGGGVQRRRAALALNMVILFRLYQKLFFINYLVDDPDILRKPTTPLQLIYCNESRKLHKQDL